MILKQESIFYIDGTHLQAQPVKSKTRLNMQPNFGPGTDNIKFSNNGFKKVYNVASRCVMLILIHTKKSLLHT